MSMWDSVQKAKRYRDKAEVTRAIADSMTNAEIKAFLIGVAEDYLTMAEIAERSFDPLPASE